MPSRLFQAARASMDKSAEDEDEALKRQRMEEPMEVDGGGAPAPAAGAAGLLGKQVPHTGRSLRESTRSMLLGCDGCQTGDDTGGADVTLCEVCSKCGHTHCERCQADLLLRWGGKQVCFCVHARVQAKQNAHLFAEPAEAPPLPGPPDADARRKPPEIDAPAPSQATASSSFARIYGLQSQPALNGMIGEVVPQSQSSERVGLRVFPGREVKLLKRANLEMLEASNHAERQAVLRQFRRIGHEEAESVDGLGRPLIRLDPDDMLNLVFRLAETGHVQGLKPLLDIAAQRFCREYDGENALSIAVAANQCNTVALIMRYRYTRYLAIEPDDDGQTPLSCVQRGNLTTSGVSQEDQSLLLRLLTCAIDDPLLKEAEGRPANTTSKGLLNFGSTV